MLNKKRENMIIFNHATSMAYVMLRKYSYHYKCIRRELSGGGNLLFILKSYVSDCNASGCLRFPDPQAIDYDKIVYYYEHNLPINNPYMLDSKYNIIARRYSRVD